MSVPVQRQKMNYFIYWKSKKPPKKNRTIFFAQFAPKTRNAPKGREDRLPYG